jgi:hypothetical protein
MTVGSGVAVVLVLTASVRVAITSTGSTIMVRDVSAVPLAVKSWWVCYEVVR